MKATSTLLLLLCAAPLAAQQPPEWQNLQVLPRDISRDSLSALMRSFATALDVRCVHCHAGTPETPFEEIDFARDERPAKEIARAMMRMVRDINARLDTVAQLEHEPVPVRCVTCHRGARRPLALEDTLGTVLARANAAAALGEYDSLRARHYGRATYDFGNPAVLQRVAERATSAGRHEDALAILERNVALFPEAWSSWFDLGRANEALGRRAAAIAAYRAVLERRPNHAPSRQRLAALDAT